MEAWGWGWRGSRGSWSLTQEPQAYGQYGPWLVLLLLIAVSLLHLTD